MHGVGFIILGAQLLQPFHSREIEKEGNSILCTNFRFHCIMN